MEYKIDQKSINVQHFNPENKLGKNPFLGELIYFEYSQK